MPLQKLEFRPGLNREGTDYANEGGWYDGDKVRFRSGFPEKIGGWSRLSNNTFLGIARNLWNWAALSGANYLGVGTNVKYYIESGGEYYDITPFIKISAGLVGPITATVPTTLNGTITSTAATLVLTSATNFPSNGIILIDSEQIGYTAKVSNTLSGLTRGLNGTTPAAHTTGATVSSNSVKIVDATYTPNVDDYINISGATGLGGNITAAVLNQEYNVANIVSGTAYTVNAKSPTTKLPVFATAGDTGNGGTITVSYQIPIGLNTYTLGTGWGAGPWGGIAGVTASLAAGPFAATVGSPNVVVTQTAHGYITGSYVTFAGATAFAGFTTGQINYNTAQLSTYQITVLSANTYQITFSSNATSTVASGGGASVTVTTQPGGWGLPYTIKGVGQQLRLWTSDNFGQDLLIAPRGGGIYYWQSSTGLNVRAESLATLAGSAYVPTLTYQVLASAIQKFVIAMGSNPYVSGNPTTDFNPMLVRWSDQLNPYEWVPDVTNQAGEFALTSGSYIVGARSTRQEILIWTDSCLYSMQYLGAPYVWGFNVMMDNISVMSPNSMITVNNVTYWMGTDKFYMYSGRVETLPCALRQYIFNDINKEQSIQVFAGTNEGYNEIWWFYVSESSAGATIDKYVIYNYVDRVWYYGNMARTAWLDSGIRDYPMAADYNNRILYHESSVDDNAGASSLPINAYIQSSDFDIGDGHNFGFVWRILPDINFNGSTVNNATVTMTIRPRVNSGAPYSAANSPSVTSADNYATSQVYNIQQFTGQVYTRLRGRQLAFRIESTGLGVSWQLGCPRIDIRPDGRR
jgi:hypothetical protein